ncbi:hypothetical protein AAFF_G00338770, partial [Aldrovandia affinis]
MAPVLIGNGGLQFWSVIGCGGFGYIYKAKSNYFGMDVAIKLLHHDDSTSLLKEAEMMLQGGSPFVLHVLGEYQGAPPGSSGPPQRGLVMEFMEMGSVESLLQRLGAPPWPLAFRLCHQVALGMNYLHRLSPPLLHLDLKPPNVLLDHGLGAKLTDFGLARFYLTVTSVREAGQCGTVSYMPPEAFNLSYKSKPAFDSYSYAIFLWSVITGEQPYSGAPPNLIMLRIPMGDRPSLEQLDRSRVKGLGEIADLMVKCWDPSPQKRPPFHDCLPVTEKVYELHKPGINDAVHQVMKSLDLGSEMSSCCSRLAAHHISAPTQLNGRASNTQLNVEEVHILEPRTREDFLQYSCQLTLDPNTAYRDLHLSEGNREATWVELIQPYPDHPERFDGWFQVLCREGLSERCYWEAEWSEGVSIAASYKEISRKGWGHDCVLGYNDKSWSLDCSPSSYSFRHNNKIT